MAGRFDTWSKTAATNATVDATITWSEGQAPSTVNNSSRAEMAALASWRDDINGSLTTAGSANAYTLTSNIAFTAYATGLMLAFKASFANTGAATLNVNSIGAKAIRTQDDVALAGGEIVQNGQYFVKYDAAANSAAGAWLLVGMSGALFVPSTANFADGSVSAPGIRFANDANTGFYRIGDDNIGVSLGGTKILDFATTGATVTGAVTATNVTATEGIMPYKVRGLCPEEGLKVLRISTTTVDIDADAVVLFTTSGTPRRYTSLNETLNITSSGANGLDTGSEGSSRWYHIWAIGKTDGTLDGLLSESATSPTMPSGYTYKGYLGAVYNDSGSDLDEMGQVGNSATAITQNAVSAGSATNFTSVSLTALVPPTATQVALSINLFTSSGGPNSVFCSVVPHGTTTTETYGRGVAVQAYTDTNTYNFGRSMCPMTQAQEIYYRVNGTNANATINVIGWQF